jgi:hypothetical protein
MVNVKSKQRICSPTIQEQTFNFASTQVVSKQKPTVKKFLDRNSSVDLKKMNSNQMVSPMPMKALHIEIQHDKVMSEGDDQDQDFAFH